MIFVVQNGKKNVVQEIKKEKGKEKETIQLRLSFEHAQKLFHKVFFVRILFDQKMSRRTCFHKFTRLDWCFKLLVFSEFRCLQICHWKRKLFLRPHIFNLCHWYDVLWNQNHWTKHLQHTENSANLNKDTTSLEVKIRWDV